MRLDRFICKHTEYSQKRARYLVATGQVRVAGDVVTDGRYEVSPFCTVMLGDKLLQQCQPHYLMLYKPAGYLSATSDLEHQTVMELVPAEIRDQLHIGGRLDLHSSGLLVLTNDGVWSRYLTAPEQKVAKVYRVETLWPISEQTAEVFHAGVLLEPEGVTTQPAQLELLAPCEARLTIYEGRYHQVKRMFQQVDNMVIALHREAVGHIMLDPALAEGECRALTPQEIASVMPAPGRGRRASERVRC